MEPQQQQQQQQDPQNQQAQQAQPQEDSSTGSSSKSSFLCRQSSTRWTPTTDQIRILKDLYYNNGVRSPSAEQIQRISARLRQYGKIEGKNVFYWFQNHKARERQKKRFTVDMAMQQRASAAAAPPPPPPPNANVVSAWKPVDDSFHPTKYTNIIPGVSSPSSSPSSPGVLSVGHMGSIGYGPVLMEKSFRDCSISQGGTSMGGSMSNNFGWIGVDPYAPPYPVFDKPKSFQFFKEQSPELETLPLFPMHGESTSGYCSSGGNPNPHGYNTNWYRPDEDQTGSRTSLELTLNSYTNSSDAD